MVIFGQSSFPRLFIRLKKRPEPPETKHGLFIWHVWPLDRREQSQVLLLQPIPIGGSTKPRHTTKPSRIRDAEFGLHDARHPADHHNHGASFIC